MRALEPVDGIGWPEPVWGIEITDGTGRRWYYGEDAEEAMGIGWDDDAGLWKRYVSALVETVQRLGVREVVVDRRLYARLDASGWRGLLGVPVVSASAEPEGSACYGGWAFPRVLNEEGETEWWARYRARGQARVVSLWGALAVADGRGAECRIVGSGEN